MSRPLRPPHDCGTMIDLRVEIDEIDRRLVDMLALRARYIDRAGVLKARAGLPATDEARARDVLEKVRAKAGEAGLDPDLAEAMWRSFIAWGVAHEEETIGKG